MELKMEPQADIALIGLAVMGQNLILNMNDHGFTVVAFNRTVSKVDDFLNNEAKGTKVIGAHSIEEMVALLKKPRRVMLMVKAGKKLVLPVGAVIAQGLSAGAATQVVGRDESLALVVNLRVPNWADRVIEALKRRLLSRPRFRETAFERYASGSGARALRSDDSSSRPNSRQPRSTE